MSRTKVQLGAISHAFEVPSDRLIDKLLPGPVAMVLGFPVTELTHALRPLAADLLKLIEKLSATSYYPTLYLSIRHVHVERLLVDLFTITAGVVFDFLGGLKMFPN